MWMSSSVSVPASGPHDEAELDDDPRTNTMLYVLFVIYFVMLVGIAVIAYGKKQAAKAAGADLSAQFGGSFSAPLLILTTFSTVFSGYTVSGVPADADRRGYLSLRWVTCVIAIVAGQLLYNPRLRRLSLDRGYISPLDFITDRYRSKLTRILGGISMCIPQVLYLTVQFVSFKGVVGGVFGLTDADVWLGMYAKTWLMIFFGMLVLGMEFIGGMNSVVLTDAVQSVIMIFSFLCVPFLIWYHYGSLSSFAPASCDNQFYVNSWTPNIHAAPAIVGPDHENATVAGCLGDTVPDFVTYPPVGGGYLLFFFTFGQISFALNPHLIQRVFIAKSDQGLRLVAIVLLISAFMTMLPGTYMGLMKKAYAPSWPEFSRNQNTFASVAEELMKKGFFPQLLMSIMLCSGMAAVMSSADSVMMGVSSTVAVDLVQQMLAPERRVSDEQTVRIGEIMSVVQVIIAIVVGRSINTSYFVTMLTLQSGILSQIVPAFILGLRTNVSVRAITAGLVVGLAGVAFFFFSDRVGWTTNLFSPLVPYPIVSLAANVLAVALVQWVAPGEDGQFFGQHYDDLCKRYGGAMLNMKTIDKVMEGTRDVPILVPIAMFTLSLVAAPIWGTGGAEEPMIAGWPQWAFILLVLCVVATLIGFVGVFIWNPPADEKEDIVKMVPDDNLELVDMHD